MLGYCTIGVKDMDKAKAFWGDLLAELGASVQIDETGRVVFVVARSGIGIAEDNLVEGGTTVPLSILTRSADLGGNNTRVRSFSLGDNGDIALRTFRPTTVPLEFVESVFFVSSTGVISQIATQGALMGRLLAHGFPTEMAIVSDDAGQFNVFRHGLCWIHAERVIVRMIPLNETHRKEQQWVRERIWELYADLKVYKAAPNAKIERRHRCTF